MSETKFLMPDNCTECDFNTFKIYNGVSLPYCALFRIYLAFQRVGLGEISPYKHELCGWTHNTGEGKFKELVEGEA